MWTSQRPAVTSSAWLGLRMSSTKKLDLNLRNSRNLITVNENANFRIPAKRAELRQAAMNTIVTFDLEFDVCARQRFQQALRVWRCVATNRDELLAFSLVIG